MIQTAQCRWSETMKTSNITICYNSEKLTALKIYIRQKNTSVEKELISVLNTMFTKYLPFQVREYISMSEKTQNEVNRKPTENKDDTRDLELKYTDGA